MDVQIPSSQSDKALPMIVYLRGDEDFVDEFRFDAQAAMDFLGIKRSRLTQISGKELRVGRVRQDRYIRPVYRMVDLEDYQQWTRQTASHQSASQAIEMAVEKLENQCQRLEDHAIVELKTSFFQLEKKLLKLVQALPQSHKDDVQRAMQNLNYSFSMLSQAAAKQQKKSFDGIQSLTKEAAYIRSTLERVAELGAYFQELNQENAVATKRIYEYLGRLDQRLSDIEQNLTESLNAHNLELTQRMDRIDAMVSRLEGAIIHLSESHLKVCESLVTLESKLEPEKIAIRPKKKALPKNRRARVRF